MEFIEYLSKFGETFEKNYPDKANRTVENYLDTFAALPPICKKSKKCAITAEEHRKNGIILFMIGKYKDAALLFTHTLREAPPYSTCAALSYASRSDALCKLKAYKECISDMERAMDLPCPKDILILLGSLKKSTLTKLNNGSNETINNAPIDDLNFTHGENSKLTGFSNGIDIVASPQDGIKLVAKIPFKAGDILVVQNPFLQVMELDKHPVYCHHCFKESLSLIPCERCTYAVYCSEKCRTEAYEKYHRIECEIHSTLMSNFPLERQGMVCQLRCLNVLTDQGTNLAAIYNDLKEIEDNSAAKLGFTGENFVGNMRKAFLSMNSGKSVKSNTRSMFEASYIVTLLRNHTNFFKTNADIPLVAKLLIKLSTAYESNHFAMPYFGKADVKARVTYPLLSLTCNHACVNNTISYINKDGKMVLRALQNMRPGDEILFSYHMDLSFEETVNRSGSIMQCKRHCRQCDKTYSYPAEKLQPVKMDQRLRTTLQKNHYDVGGLWKLFNIIHGKHQRYTVQAQIVKSMLVDAYEGRNDRTVGSTNFHILGIL